ncbi:MAG: Ig-like domain-containing protein [Phycisphaerales bacterium]
MFRSADLEGRSAIWSGVLEPGERAFTPCNPVAADALRFFLLSAGLRASIVTPAEAERARTGGPFVPVLASRFGTDIAILSGLRAFQVIDELFDVSVNGPRVLLVENPGQQAVGGLAFVQLNASSNSDLGAITLPPYNSCRPILSKSRGVRGTFDGHVLRTGLSDLDPDAELRVECVEIPTGTTPEILAPFALVELVQREGDRAEFRLRSIVPTFDGQFPVRVRLTSADSDGTRFSPTREAFYVTLDQVADPPSEPRLEPSTDRGSSNSDGITSTGPVLLTGTGEAYARVMLQRGRRPLGAASAVVAPNGTWSISFTPPTPGVYTLTAVQLDEAGNLSERSEPTTIRVVRPPAPPGAVSVPRRDRVALRDGVLVVTPRARIEGRDTPGTLIVVRVNCQEVGTARTGPMGRWSLVLPAPLSNERVSEIVAARRAAGGVDSLPGPVLRVRARP